MFVRPLTSALQQKAEKELGENPNRIQKDLDHIKEWIFKQPHLKARTDDQWLLSFLRGCKFSLERTKSKLDAFYTMKTLVPELFTNRDPFLPEIQEMLKQGGIGVLPKTAGPAGPKILTVRCGVANPEKLSVVTSFKVLLMALDILFLEDDNCTVAGQYILVDFENFAYKYAAQITPTCLIQILKCLQDGYPTRVKGAYLVNAPAFFVTLYNTIKLILKKKLRSRIHFYNKNNINELHKCIPLSFLPSENGGTGGSYAEMAAQWKLKVESYRDWFLEDAQYCTDEGKRPGKPITSEIVFGIEGSFRKLELD